MTEIGNYTIINQLGEGGMAIVYLAEHKTLGHKVAIKVLAKEFLYNKGIKDRFIDEAKKMVRMNHPNVVKVTDLINDGDTVAIVMEYVDGETLRDLLSKKKLNDNEIENYIKQMVSALDYVHKQGLVHRDVKPSNFIFNSEGILKLADFGISKNLPGELNEGTQTGTTMSMGTPMYMSPEQVRSTKDVTYLSDIYSLGVVLWEMAAGKKPYDLVTLSTYDLMTKVVNDSLPLTSTKWDGVIQKATEKTEAKRFKDFKAFLEIRELEKVDLNQEERTVISNSEFIPNPKTVEKTNKVYWKWLSILGGIGLFCLVLFILYFPKHESNSKKSEITKRAGTSLEVDSLVTDSKKKGVIEKNVYPRDSKNNSSVDSKWKDNYDSFLDLNDAIIGVEKSNKWGFVTNVGKEVVPCIYDHVSPFYSELAEVGLKGKKGMINKKGDVIVPIIYDEIQYDVNDRISQDLIAVLYKGNWGYVSKVNGKVMIPYKFGYALPFSENYAVIAVPGFLNKRGFINKNGEIVFSSTFEDAFSFSSIGLAGVRKDGKWGYIDRHGNVQIPFIYDKVYGFSDEVATVIMKGKEFKINKTGECVKNCQ